MNHNKHFWLLSFVLLFTAYSCSNSTEVDFPSVKDDKQYLKHWKIESATQVKQDQALLTSAAYDDDSWVDAHVPTTVLRALVDAGVYPDPHLDLNNFKIPDASEALNQKLDLAKYSHIKGVGNPFKDPYWYRTTFDVAAGQKGKRVWLNFDGINYRADVWVNGKQIAAAPDMVGMFTRFKYDITDAVDFEKKNVLAVKIHQVDHPGTPEPGAQLVPFGPQRGWGVDIFKDATLKFTAGWDCAPVIRDRNMGLYQDVFLSFTQNVDILDPYVVTDLPLPNTDKADLTVHTELSNPSDKAVKGVLKGKINLMKEVDFITYTETMEGDMPTVYFQKEITIPAHKTIDVSISPKDAQSLSIANPHLWWPNGYGEQYLHTLDLVFEVDGQVSDYEDVTFGIREIDNTLKELNGEFGRIFWVNGKRIFSKGGWLQPDMLLDMNEKRMYDEARLLAESNVNMIANEDMPSPPNHILEAYDKYGLLMWETFFQCWTSYPGTESFANPVDTDLAIKGALDIIKRYRHHASLSVWAIACETVVREEIYSPVRNAVKDMDPTRPFLATSSYDWDIDSLTPYMKPDLPLGMTDDGAPDYTWYPHDYYYDMILKVKQQMFRNELGVPSVPTLSSMKKFIFDLGEGPKNDIYPLDKNWAHHGAWDDDGYVYRAYDEALRRQFGQPGDAEEYIRNAQIINAGSYRAMYEAANHRMWDITSGVMLWKLNSTWPTVVWQLYDWFLNPTSAYFYAKKAMEPLHIQLNEHDHTVSVINAMHEAHNLKAKVTVYNYDLSSKWNKEVDVNIAADKYEELFKLPSLAGLSDIYFIDLKLMKGEVVVSENFYWMSSTGKNDFSKLGKMAQPELDIDYSVSNDAHEVIVTGKVTNNSDQLAFLRRFEIQKGKGGEEVLPTFWDDNFITLLPGESKTLTARMTKSDLDGKQPVMAADMQK